MEGHSGSLRSVVQDLYYIGKGLSFGLGNLELDLELYLRYRDIGIDVAKAKMIACRVMD